MVKIRRRGAAIVETKKGILVVAWEKGDFMIPGGGAHFWETRRMAAKRELEEETGLKVKSSKFLFKYIGPEHKNKKGKLQRNNAKVFLMNVEGNPKALNEIKRIGYWKPGSKIKLMKGAQMALDIYLGKFRNK
jgi:8-oxo-dGTP pyrophosphatase MutT (NUDIX family)